MRAPGAAPTVLGVLGCLLLAPAPAGAGAWLQDEGAAYLRFGSGVLTTRERYDGDGERVQWDTSGGGFRDARYQDVAFSLYAEVGVRHGWNAIVSAGWSRLRAEQPSAVFTTRGFTDLTFGVKRALWNRGRAVTAAATLVSVPTGYAVEDYPALGSGVTDLAVQLLAGASAGGIWATTELEYRVRGGAFRDQVRGAVGGGWNAARRFGVRAELRGTAATGHTPEAAAAGGDRFDPTAADPRYLDAAATASVTPGRGLAVEIEVRSTVMGENTLAGTRWTLAVATSPAWRWRR